MAKKTISKKSNFDVSQVYKDLYAAFDFYNTKLFTGSLPKTVISIRAKANSVSYFAPDRFISIRDKKKAAHEIAFNPALLNRPIQVIFSTLVHEMVHLWQEKFGKPSKNKYHNKEWADKMESIGLMPAAADGSGKRTGSKMSHEIISAGLFARKTFNYIKSREFNFFYEVPIKTEKKDSSKIKFTCPKCECNAWGKESLILICGECDAQMEIQD